MKTIKVYKEIQCTSKEELLKEIELLKSKDWDEECEIYIDTSKGLNKNKYNMYTIKLSKNIIC